MQSLSKLLSFKGTVHSNKKVFACFHTVKASGVLCGSEPFWLSLCGQTKHIFQDILRNEDDDDLSELSL